MPRKATAASADPSAPAPEPRRSSRIKDLPKAESAPKKAPAKPRAKKADREKQEAEAADKEEKPKSARGKKRKEPEPAEANGAPETAGDKPATKKVRAHFPCSTSPACSPNLLAGQAFLQGR